MTDREKEILTLIENDPFITQESLADTLGIQRSSVAVHISNLTKKGYIKGRGYIVNSTSYIVVIGGSNMDIIGTPLNPIRAHDSNIGEVITRTGGVGRNIAESLARLSHQVHLISVVGSDDFGKKIIDELVGMNIDRQGVLVTDQSPTSTYLCINDHIGDMALAISQMDAITAIDSAYLNGFDKKIEGATAIVLDTNLTKETLTYIMHKYHHKKIYIDPVSTIKAEKLIDLLPYITFLKPNLIEAEVLLGLENSFGESEILYAQRLAKGLIAKGVQEVAVSIGEKGVVFANKDTTKAYENFDIEVLNTTGAGDAFFSGYITKAMQDADVDDRIKYALGCAAFQISKKDAKMQLTHEGVVKLIEER